MARLDIKGCLDLPLHGGAYGGMIVLQGWVLVSENQPVEIKFRLNDKAAPVTISRITRPDVHQAYPAYAALNPTPGFSASLNSHQYPNGRYILECLADYGYGIFSIAAIPIVIENTTGPGYYQHIYTAPLLSRQLTKLHRLLEILQCPYCGAGIQQVAADAAVCRSGEHHFPIVNGTIVTIDGTPDYPIDQLLPTSSHFYPPEVLDRLFHIHEQGGLALDIGAGWRHFGSEHLIQLEICNYPFTDVVNQNNHLPFKDASFDFIFCLAVTEHVRQPWTLAAEIQRILKPNGWLHIDSAFMQPLHGYPAHYFNITHWGLEELFKDMQIVSLQPAPYQHPWFALNWMLGHLIQELPPDVARLPLADFVAEMASHIHGKGSSYLDRVKLSQEREFELAAGFTLQAVKPGEPES